MLNNALIAPLIVFLDSPFLLGVFMQFSFVRSAACLASVAALSLGTSSAMATVTAHFGNVFARLDSTITKVKKKDEDQLFGGSNGKTWIPGRGPIAANPASGNSAKTDPLLITNQGSASASWADDFLSGEIRFSNTRKIEAGTTKSFERGSAAFLATWTYNVEFDLGATLAFSNLGSLDTANNSGNSWVISVSDVFNHPVYSWTSAEFSGLDTLSQHLLAGRYSIQLRVNGSSPADLTKKYAGGTDGTFDWSLKEDVPPAVPEPASWALMLGGFGMVGGALRASRRKATAAFG